MMRLAHEILSSRPRQERELAFTKSVRSLCTLAAFASTSAFANAGFPRQVLIPVALEFNKTSQLLTPCIFPTHGS
jgi:hypothetical protein